MRVETLMSLVPVRKCQKASRMDPFRDEVLRLRTSGYSLTQIQIFLANKGVDASVPAIHGFIKRAASSTNLQGAQ